MTQRPRYDADEVGETAKASVQLIAETVLGPVKNPGAVEWRFSGKTCPYGAINLNRIKGAWDCKTSSDSGNLFGLWAMHIGLPDAKGANFGPTLSSLADFLGVPPVSGAVDGAERARTRAKVERARQERADAAAVELARVEAVNAVILSDMQAAAVPVAGTIAETYLRSRGITAGVPASFAQFIPSGALGRYRRGMVASDAPALAVWGRNVSGEVASVSAQRVLLTDGGAKLVIETDDGPASKFTNGKADGVVVALPPVDPVACGGALLVCEGPETALAAWQASGAETWCVFGVSGWAGLVDLLPRDRRVILCPDADAIGSQAWQAFEEGRDATVSAGVDTWIAETPPRYGVKADLGDVLERDGNDAVRAVVAAARPAGAPCPDSEKKAHLDKLKGSRIGTEAPRVAVDFLPVVEASARVTGAVEDLFADAQAWNEREDGDDVPAPVHVLRATAGLGKSRSVRDVIGAALPGIPSDRAVYVFVPTLKLADEAQEAFALEYPLWASAVFRGRGATNPADVALDEPSAMCAQPDLAKAMSASGLSVRPHLCEGAAGSAPCRSGCAYLDQVEKAPRVVFLSHNYLGYGIPEGMPCPWCIVIDENLDRARCTVVTLEMLNEVPSFDFDFDGEEDETALRAAVARMKNAGGVAGYAAAQGRNIVSALKGEGYTVEDAEQFDALEKRAAADFNTSNISPVETEAAIAAEVAARMKNPALDSHKRARFWRIIGQEWDGDGQSLVVRDVVKEGENKRRVVMLFHRSTIRVDAPALLIDADACPVVTAAAYPGRTFTRVDVRLNTHVVQITDSAMSKHKLTRADGCDRKRRAFGFMVAREIVRAGDDAEKVLIVTTKGTACALLRDDAPGLSDADIEGVASAGALRYRGAWLAWFGPSTRGVDRWKDCETVVILGSHAPPVDAIEDKARSIFGDDGEPLHLLALNEAGEHRFPMRQEGIALRDGGRVSVEVGHHPDARADALLRQFREQSTIQAIARVRAVHCTKPKRVVILSNVPLEGVEVDELTTWQEFKPDRMEAAMFERAAACAAQGLPFGMRYSNPGFAADAPEEFPSLDAIKSWKRCAGIRGVIPLVGSIKGMTPLTAKGMTPLTRICEVAFRLKGQSGSAVPAVIVCNPSDVTAAAVQLWGPMASVEIVAIYSIDPVPSPASVDAAVDLAILAGQADLAPLASAIVADGPSIFARGGDACAVIRKAATVSGSDFGAACTALNLSCNITEGAAA